jgi:5-oxoprolinase (ATP-hydrolysing)
MAERGVWQFFIDRGGTFTDCIARDPSTGAPSCVKVLSSDRAPLIGIRRLLGLREPDPIAPCEVRLGTTLAAPSHLRFGGRRGGGVRA